MRKVTGVIFTYKYIGHLCCVSLKVESGVLLVTVCKQNIETGPLLSGSTV